MADSRTFIRDYLFKNPDIGFSCHLLIYRYLAISSNLEASFTSEMIMNGFVILSDILRIARTLSNTDITSRVSARCIGVTQREHLVLLLKFVFLVIASMIRSFLWVCGLKTNGDILCKMSGLVENRLVYYRPCWWYTICSVRSGQESSLLNHTQIRVSSVMRKSYNSVLSPFALKFAVVRSLIIRSPFWICVIRRARSLISESRVFVRYLSRCIWVARRLTSLRFLLLRRRKPKRVLYMESQQTVNVQSFLLCGSIWERRLHCEIYNTSNQYSSLYPAIFFYLSWSFSILGMLIITLALALNFIFLYRLICFHFLRRAPIVLICVMHSLKSS